MKLQNQKVIIMGGTSGMGLATAKAAAAAGAAVVITGRDQNKLDNALAELPQGVIGKVVDATVEKELRDFFRRSEPFDHLVLAVSGREGGGSFESLGVDTLKRAFDGKFWAQFMAAQMGLAKLRKKGSIVFITAASARTSIPGTAGLAAINGALEAMIPTLALELKPIRVNAVSPGVVKTPWWDTLPSEQREAVFAQTAQILPVGRIGTPEDIAEVIIMLLRNGFMTGTVIECDGGIRIKQKEDIYQNRADLFFTCFEMFIVGSNYPNMALGLDKGDVEKDAQGLETMRVLGKNMAFLLKKIKAHSTSNSNNTGT